MPYTIIALLFSAIVAVFLFAQRDNSQSELAPAIERFKNKTAPSGYFLSYLGLIDIGIDKDEAYEWITANWSPQLLPYFIEPRRFAAASPEVQKLTKLFEKKTGVDRTDDDGINQYIWSQEIENTSDYAAYKQLFHSQIDPKFTRYFEPECDFDIRLDEVTWGGVIQDGIPPLRQPKMLSVADAEYLSDSDVVFGIKINGDARAYPKRILAWHEMFVDQIGGQAVAGVYCTLCGTVIAYRTEFEGVNHALGTSGFLYRSNKLMYDQATQSLWSTLEGTPVIGPLVGKGIRLDQYWVVTTTWGAWKQRHPDTQVLSLSTGYQRDYREGVAYKSYFATDDRMFETPYTDTRLKNKDEVLALRFSHDASKPLVIYEGFLKQHPLYQAELGGKYYVILTDQSGANRVFERAASLDFVEWDGDATVKDSEGSIWTMTEEFLESDEGNRLKRLPAHRAFWFGWHGAFPNTVLIQ